ncbi:TIM-barrel domain-containing protein, partial [Arachidicoccus sp.]|uniref:TIM-barrel domain-containing protein n=1 Tax=Arachidicoccus sp. TaxID=1872624 RepID=UPI003D20CFE8
PFIISLEGWAGTQRYASVWSGDQTGGEWEYIRFHIPTFIGSGLSGQPNITSDMDGIFGGKNPIINARCFEWKTFTPMQLNMDGWGANPKYPEAMGEPTASINRTYLKLKSELLPYTYSLAKEAVTGLPIIRAMFLEQANAYTLGKATAYQFMYGPSFLIAPIYQATEMDKDGNDIRNNIYLPNGTWVDYFTGQEYNGNCIVNSFDAPIWKLPVFVKRGSIIPMNNANNHVGGIDENLRSYEVYPFGHSSFTQYDDDGTTQAYKNGVGATTLIESSLDGDNATVTIHPTKGSFNGFVKRKITEFKIDVSAKPKKITASIGGKTSKLTEVKTLEDFNKSSDAYYYNAAPNLNQFATAGSPFAKLKITKNPQVWVKVASTDISSNSVIVEVKGFEFKTPDNLKTHSGILTAPANVSVPDSNKTAYSLNLTWHAVSNADFYEIEFDHMRYTTIKGTHFLFENLNPKTNYAFKIRAVNKGGFSDWAALTTTTNVNPLEFAIHGIVAKATANSEDGNELSKLFDFDENSIWHTSYGKTAVPFDIVMDLRTINQLDRFEYLPRISGRNGIPAKGTVYYSLDKNNWVIAGTFDWNIRDNGKKVFDFAHHPSARYIKISVTEGGGNYGSGRELYVFKVPGTESYLQGDINNDHKIDNNDLTSYMNYTGLRKGDADFEGYISKGDINKNDLIDAYDISTVATQLDGGVKLEDSAKKVSGSLEMSTAKQTYKKRETIDVIVKGTNLTNVNALSFALPYNPQDYEYIGVQTLNTKDMENLTYDRLHSDGSKVLYPTFVNLGDKIELNGNDKIFIIKFKAKQNLHFNLKFDSGVLVDKSLNYSAF